MDKNSSRNTRQDVPPSESTQVSSNSVAILRQLKSARRKIVLFLGGVFVLIPYISSRVAAAWQMVAVYELPESSAPIENNGRLRVACYNIAHGRGLASSNLTGGDLEERSRRLREIAEQLRQMDADVVVLNEVDFESSWSYGVNQAEELARLAGYPYRVEQRNLDLRVAFWTLRFGNAVLSRYPITSSQLIDLPGDSRLETTLGGKKRAICADIRCADRTIRVIGAHLSFRSEPVRVASANMIRDVASQSDVPVVLAGDMNSTPPEFPQSISTVDNQNAITTLTCDECFSCLPQSSAATTDLTFPSDDPCRVIDWIMVSADLNFVAYDVIDSTLSDHKAVVAEISLSGAPMARINSATLSSAR